MLTETPLLNKPKPVFLSAEWRKLAIVNYEIDPKILFSFLPYKTDLDHWNSKCYVSLVGFRFLNTKLKGISIPFHSDFEEVNLRFYVKYNDNGTLKRGVTFIKEIVPKPALTFVANTIYKEKYCTNPMKHRWKFDKDCLNLDYQWKHLNKWNKISITADSKAEKIAEGSEEEFITEHYWGYTKIHHQKTSEYQVEHPRWEVYKIKNHEVDVDFGKVYGKEFHFLSKQTPASVMLAEGSEILVRQGKKL